MRTITLSLLFTLVFVTAGASVPYTAAPSPRIPESMTFCDTRIDLTPVDRYERLDRELTSVIYGHSNTLLTLKRANKYFPVMAPILKANGIPLDFLYLACVESHLSHRAYSPAKAVGIWQFIPSTAAQYGLEVNDEVDERYNLEKATAAACRYFRATYNKYHDWPSVMASFNGGMGRISGELDKQQCSTALDLYLTEETSRYVFRIMAMKAVLENPSAFGFKVGKDQYYYPVECKAVEVSEPVEDWPTWALEHGVTYSSLREANPWIRAKKLTNKEGRTYVVQVPLKDSLNRRTAKKSLYNSNWE